ncbi:hypothetical protein [Gimesia chilikensis]|uniref:hypothetical protein n=1 Tax=Gimesia chilikensis TaxID=2605989 RepID=UPI003A92C196
MDVIWSIVGVFALAIFLFLVLISIGYMLLVKFGVVEDHEKVRLEAEEQARLEAEANMTDEERLLAKIDKQQEGHADRVIYAIIGAAVMSALFKWAYNYLW